MFTDDDLLALARHHDPGLSLDRFIDQLRWVTRITPGRTIGYGVDADELDAVKTRLTTWADRLGATGSSTPPARSPHRPPMPRAAPPTDGPTHRPPPDDGGPSIGF